MMRSQAKPNFAACCFLLLSTLLTGCDIQQQVATPTLAPATPVPIATASTGNAGTERQGLGAVTQPTEALTATSTADLRRGTSIAKIEAALSAGRIDHDTALAHLLVAAYDPSSLPAEFRGDSGVGPIPVEGTTLLATLSSRLDKLSPALRDEVQPFLRRPTDPQSFWHKRLADSEGSAVGAAKSPTPAPDAGEFEYVDDPGTNLRIWYLTAGGATARTQAGRLAVESGQSNMWPIEKQVMLGNEPCSDADLKDNGGDGRLDVYILPRHALSPRTDDSGEPVPFESAGLTIPLFTGGECPVAGFLLVNKSLGFDNLRSTLAHELFHAFQFSFNTPYYSVSYEEDYGWWMEASATWAEDLIYPDLNSEWIWLKPGGWADKDGPSGPLDAFTRGGYEQYGAYIWAFYLTRRPGGDPQTIGRIMKAGEEVPVVAAMSSMPDWATGFKEFALWNWNKPSAQKYDDDGKRIQPLKQKAVPLSVDLAAGQPSTQMAAEVDLPKLSIRYYNLTVGSGVEQLRLDLGGITAEEGAGVQAIVTVGDPQNPDRIYNDDWSARREVTFCRGVADEAVDNIVLVVSNSLPDGEKNLTGQIMVEAAGGPCSAQPVPSPSPSGAAIPQATRTALPAARPVRPPSATPTP